MKRWLALLVSILIALSGLAVAEGGSPASDKEAIEAALDLSNDPDQAWTYSSDADAWTLSIVTAVTDPVIEDEEGVSVCVPGAYVSGIDTDGDGMVDVSAETAAETVYGGLVIDYDASVTSTNGQTYTAATAPVILNTGAAGYGNASNTPASTTYASEGYINVSCGNRGKQDSITDASGNTVYTGDAPSCLVDQKAAARYVKYNILLGNLPGSVDRFVSTGGSGGGAHAAMFALTGNSPDFYDYLIEVGAVGVYKNEDGSYTTTVTIDGEEVELSDAAWGCIAYSAITPLYEADMALAMEYTLNADFSYGSAFQQALAGILSQEYMDYINAQALTVEEARVGFDLDGDGALESAVPLSIEYDQEKYADTNGYGGSYMDLYLAELTENLQWYVDNLSYAEGWTWFDAEGNALSDEDVAQMTDADRTQAFIEGRYAKASGGGRMDGFGGGMGGFPGGKGQGGTGRPEGLDGELPEGMGRPEGPDGELPEGTGPMGGGGRGFDNADVATNSAGDELDVGTPDAGTTQAAGSSTDSRNYESYDELLAAYQQDIAQIEAGDRYGNNIVELYDPLEYIGAEDTEDPMWIRIVCGAVEGDIAMFDSLNTQLAALDAGIDATIEWQWDGGHVPGEVLGNSFALWVDTMYGAHVDGAAEVTKAQPVGQTVNGDAESATGTDLSGWVDVDEYGNVSFTLSDAMAYRTSGASKAVPGFDVIDYGQEDYVFGDDDTDARHWSAWVLKALEENRETLEPLFNGEDQ
ncbi:MAG: hypothetical protein E7317_02480 [Clostridiales bacterium]|nr:hypothetical protein [Clostridiales bacterium]